MTANNAWHQGKQDKHLVGTNNYKPGRSVLLADPRELLRQFAGRGKPMNNFPPGTAGYKERLDTGDRIIGIWKSRDGSQMAEPTRGAIIYDGQGTAQFAPAKPEGLLRP
jgi:filamentous hemagglutinin